MNINPSWNYELIVKNIRTLKLHYEEMLASFLCIQQKNKFIKKTRDSLYSLNLKEYQKDRIWEYMNGFLSPIKVYIIFGFLEED